MVNLYFIRHGITQWNIDKKMQGRTNIPLNAQGRDQISSYQLPETFRHFTWYTSPLLRARETADILGLNAATAHELIEMNWGTWEGHTLAQLREQDAQGVAENEAKGLDLMPPQGESPRDVAARVSQWVEQLDALGTDQDIGCVCHKGIIRAVYAQAAQWDMMSKAPDKLDYHCAQKICYHQGVWSIGELNISLK